MTKLHDILQREKAEEVEFRKVGIPKERAYILSRDYGDGTSVEMLVVITENRMPDQLEHEESRYTGQFVQIHFQGKVQVQGEDVLENTNQVLLNLEKRAAELSRKGYSSSSKDGKPILSSMRSPADSLRFGHFYAPSHYLHDTVEEIVEAMEAFGLRKEERSGAPIKKDNLPIMKILNYGGK